MYVKCISNWPLLTKLIHRLYVNIIYIKNIQGCRHTKDKTRFTVMVFITTNGDKIPLSVVGKSSQPVCFKNTQPQIPYTYQANACFDKYITWWWIREVLKPYHSRVNGFRVPYFFVLEITFPISLLHLIWRHLRMKVHTSSLSHQI